MRRKNLKEIWIPIFEDSPISWRPATIDLALALPTLKVVLGSRGGGAGGPLDPLAINGGTRMRKVSFVGNHFKKLKTIQNWFEAKTIKKRNGL